MKIETLNAIYNTLCQIETKGESTVLMGACLQTIREEIQNMRSEAMQENIEA